MNLGWLRGQSRTLGLNLSPQADLAFDGEPGSERFAAPDVRRQIILDGTLVHERTHWLHYIGTTTGVFHIAVWEAQAHAGKQIISELGDTVDSESFPLSSLGFRTDPGALTLRVAALLDGWLGLRDLNYWFAGNQFVGAVRSPNRMSFKVLSNFIKTWLIQLHPGPDAEKHSGTGRYEPPARFGEISGMAEKGMMLGMHHLTECSARLNEYACMQHGLLKIKASGLQSAELALDTSYLLEGDYGQARKRFYELTGRRLTHESEAILAVLVLEALNTTLPPISSMAGFSEPWYSFHPFYRFIAFVRLTATYAPKVVKSLGPVEFAIIREEVRSLLLEQNLILPDLKLQSDVRRLFSGFADVTVPDDLYIIKEGLSTPTDYMRYKYLGRLVYDAFDLYRTEPGLIAFPALYQAVDPKRFQFLFNPIRPPVHFIEGEGYRPTWEDPAGHAVLMLDAMVNEIIFAAMNCGYMEMLQALRALYHHTLHQLITSESLRVALLNAGFTESFAAVIHKNVCL